MKGPHEVLKGWNEEAEEVTLERAQAAYDPLYTYRIPYGENRQYAQQYADIYFLRQQKLRKAVEKVAREHWEGFSVAGEKAKHVERVLDVRQGELSWMVGTIFADLPMKPNVLDDVTRDHYIAEAPPRRSYHQTGLLSAYMIEDRSGRLRLAGKMLKQNMLVTGAIVAVLGTENANGDFEILAMQFPDLPPQPERWSSREAEDDMDTKDTKLTGKKIAFISGLEFSGKEADSLYVDMLVEYLLGEIGGTADSDTSSSISRLIIAGNSVSPEVIEEQPLGEEDYEVEDEEKPIPFLEATTYNPEPTTQLDEFLSEILPSVPVTIMPGQFDISNYSLPQQPVHPALLPRTRCYASTNIVDPEQDPGWFDSITNPWEGDIDGWRLLGNAGQPVDDILKYVRLRWLENRSESSVRLDIMELMLRWRSSAPTAPDTLWCYPYQDHDPFVLSECPHVYFVGNQPEFGSATIVGDEGQKVTLFTIPKFKETGELVLLNTDDLSVEVVQFDFPRLD